MPSLTCLSWWSKCCDEVNDKDNSHTTWEAAGVIQVKVSLRNGMEAFMAFLYSCINGIFSSGHTGRIALVSFPPSSTKYLICSK
jgi:hypothetical protein